MTSAIYVLDANVFIEAARRYYGFDLAPKFWESLISHADDTVRSIDSIKVELQRGKDELAEWAHTHFGHAFASTNDAEVVSAYGKIMPWVQGHTQFSAAAKADFANSADGWLVAYAMAKSCVLVTHEVLDPNVKSKVPIPNICQQFGVRHVDTFTMLRELGVRFT